MRSHDLLVFAAKNGASCRGRPSTPVGKDRRGEFVQLLPNQAVERGETLLLAPILDRQLTESVEAFRNRRDGRLVGLEIGCVTGNQKSSLSGLSILDQRQEDVRRAPDPQSLLDGPGGLPQLDQAAIGHPPERCEQRNPTAKARSLRRHAVKGRVTAPGLRTEVTPSRAASERSGGISGKPRLRNARDVPRWRARPK
jgi:hypothetical protein